MASGDVAAFPVRGYAFRVGPLPLFDADGDLVTGATGLDSEVSKDFGTFADCTNEATEVATNSGLYYLDLTATEMTAAAVAVIVKTSSSGAKTTPILIATRVLPTYLTGTAQAGAAGTLTLASGASATDDLYTGMLLGITSGTGAGQQPRVITDYVGSTKVATIAPDWTTTPDNTSVYAVLDQGFGAVAPTAAEYATAAATSVWAAGTRSLTDPVTIVGTLETLDDLENISVADVWNKDTAELTTVGSVGKRLADDIDATISSRASAANLAIVDDLLDTEVAAIKTDTAAILADTGTDGVIVASIAANAITYTATATDLDVYQARVFLFDDDAASTDRYVVIWHKNGMPVLSGITTPLIQVWAASNGADLIAETTMTQIASTGTYRYNATTTARTVAGAAYIAKVTATIDGSARTAVVPVGSGSTA